MSFLRTKIFSTHIFIYKSALDCNMETITIPKESFKKILLDMEILLDDVEFALDKRVQQRISDIETGEVEGKSEEEYYAYLAKRGIKIGN